MPNEVSFNGRILIDIERASRDFPSLYPKLR